MNSEQKEGKFGDYPNFNDFYSQSDYKESQSINNEEDEDSSEDNCGNTNRKISTQTQSLFPDDEIDYPTKKKLMDLITKCEKYSILWSIYISDLYDQFARYLSLNNNDPRYFMPVMSPEMAAKLKKEEEFEKKYILEKLRNGNFEL